MQAVGSTAVFVPWAEEDDEPMTEGEAVVEELLGEEGAEPSGEDGIELGCGAYGGRAQGHSGEGDEVGPSLRRSPRLMRMQSQAPAQPMPSGRGRAVSVAAQIAASAEVAEVQPVGPPCATTATRFGRLSRPAPRADV